MTTYNGHKNWTHWNVSLWISNDEGIYRRAMHHVKTSPTKDIAAMRLMAELPTKTPDGARYGKSAIRAALVGM